MITTNDVHYQFALAFPNQAVQAYAYLLSKRLAEGHTCIDADAILTIDGETHFAIQHLPSEKELTPFVAKAPNTNAPFVADGQKIYFQRYYVYEQQIIERLTFMIQKSQQLAAHRLQQLQSIAPLIATLNDPRSVDDLAPHEKPDWQLAASIIALLNNFTIITGGPGTGKTTTLIKLMQLIFATQPNAKLALAAPTGKASMRMYESLNQSAKNLSAALQQRIQQLQPSTLHGLLGYQHNSIYFKHHANNPLPYNWVVIDEASMIDVPMFAKLLNALHPESRLILLGDKDQLASVEAGSLMGDLCNPFTEINTFDAATITQINTFISNAARKIPDTYAQTQQHPLANCIVQLKLSHRFTSNSIVGQLSKSVIQNHQAALKQLLQQPHEDFKLDEHYTDETLFAFAQHFEAYIREKDIATALTLLNTCRILVAVKDGPQGVAAMNKKVEMYLLSRKLVQLNSLFYINRPVMITRNNYELNLFNGDIGIVRYDENGTKRVWFEDAEKGVRGVLPAYLDDVETVFAMTIHKSQGSEFNKVMVVLPAGGDNPLLTRELLYTAITRAKQQIVLQGSKEQIAATAAASVKRITGINDKW